MNRKKRYILFAKISVPYNLIMAAGKLVIGLFTLSFFLCVNAFYNIGLALAKFIALKTHNDTELKDMPRSERIKKQYEFYGIIGIILMVTSIVYLIFCAQMFVYHNNTQYPQVVGIAIAAVTFTEIGLSLTGIRRMRREYEPMLEAIKYTNLASSLISLVLTQAALLSLTMMDMSFFNGLLGITVGGAAAIIGLCMLIRAYRYKSGKVTAALTAKITSKLHSSDLCSVINADGGEDYCIEMLYKLKDGCDKAAFSKLKERIEDCYPVKLFDVNEV